MAIQTKIKLSESRELDGAYLKVINPYSYKAFVKDKEGKDTEKTYLALGYHVESWSELDGTLLKTTTNYTEYDGGDIWDESYKDLKTIYKDSKDV